jgi:hypothetical protein
MTLPSNVATSKYFVQNTIANFTTKLPAHISLDGKWEVGLSEISYTKSWYNVPEDHEIQIWYMAKGNKDSTILKNVYFKRGFYKTIDDVVETLNSLINKFDDDENNRWDDQPMFKRNMTNRLVTIEYGKTSDKRRLLVMLDHDLCQILGFDFEKLKQSNNDILLDYVTTEDGWLAKLKSGELHDESVDYLDELLNKYKRFTATSPFDLSGGYHSLFVYCNVVQPSYVGDSFTQLLRIVEIPTEKIYGDQVHLHYSTTHYVPLLTQEFETIEIDIKAETGESVPFEFGRSILTLHFRRKSL